MIGDKEKKELEVFLQSLDFKFLIHRLILDNFKLWNISSMGITCPKIDWTEVNGNPFVRKLSPMMLDDDGLNVRASVTLKNDAKGTEQRLYEIHYDRKYAIKKVVNDILRPLNFQTFNDFQQFISDCWKEYKKQQARTK